MACKAVETSMVDRHRRFLAPVVVWGATRALTGGAEPAHILVEALVGDGTTEWQVAWTTGSLVGFVSASKDVEGWSAYSNDGVPDTLTSWARPLTDVQVVRLDTVDLRRERSGWGDDGTWHWSATATIEFRDGSQLQVPPSGAVTRRCARPADPLVPHGNHAEMIPGSPDP